MPRQALKPTSPRLIPLRLHADGQGAARTKVSPPRPFRPTATEQGQPVWRGCLPEFWQLAIAVIWSFAAAPRPRPRVLGPEANEAHRNHLHFDSPPVGGALLTANRVMPQIPFMSKVPEMEGRNGVARQRRFIA